MDLSYKILLNISTQAYLKVIIAIAVILLLYLVVVLILNLKKHKQDEDEIKDIIASAEMGIWRIELVENRAPRMYADKTMKDLLGITDPHRTPEEVYNDWYSNVTPEAVASVNASVDRMKQGFYDENTYLWKHPTKGIRYVRCGGTSQVIQGGVALRGYHYDVDEVVRADQAQVQQTKQALAEKQEFFDTLNAVCNTFHTMHVINLCDDTCRAFTAEGEVAKIVDHEDGAVRMMRQVMETLVVDEYKDQAFEFSDLTTVADRLRNKDIIEKELLSIDVGWFLASFIVMDRDKDGKVERVLFITRVIDDMKKNEEKLIHTSQTDALTKVFNRRAYEEAVIDLQKHGIPDDFVYVSIDLNGLKVVNDTLGHEAGDELITGAISCIRKAVGNYGSIYRTGGDEFIVLLNADGARSKKIEKKVNELIDNWHGKKAEHLSVSYGIVSKAENPTATLHDIITLAENRMLENKSRYYQTQGIDRRGRKAAHVALLALYSKVLKINVTNDSYQIIDLVNGETVLEDNANKSIAAWFKEFADKGLVHPEDLPEYNRVTELQFLRDRFKENSEPLYTTYRRKNGEEYRLCSMEIIKANDYSDDDQNLFLYIKNIG